MPDKVPLDRIRIEPETLGNLQAGPRVQIALASLFVDHEQNLWAFKSATINNQEDADLQCAPIWWEGDHLCIDLRSMDGYQFRRQDTRLLSLGLRQRLIIPIDRILWD